MKRALFVIAILICNLFIAYLTFVGAQTTDEKPVPIDIYPLPRTHGENFVVADKWNKLDLTFTILNCPSRIDCVSGQDAVRAAFRKWDSVSGLRFTEVSSGGDIEVMWTVDDYEFGYDGDVLAYAFFPSDGGDVFFDDAETWTLYDGSEVDLYVVALHEIGHALGIDHSDDDTAVMFAFSGYARDLQPDDIRAVERLYGSDDGSTSEIGSSDGAGSFPAPQAPPPVAQAETGEGLLDDENYYEIWEIGVDAGETITITMESRDLDAYLVLLDQDFETVLAEDDDSLGDYNAQITYTFGQGGTYSIIATSYSGGSGSYNLQVYRQGVNPVPPPPPVNDIPVATPQLTISNFSGTDLCELYVSPTSSDEWGDNLIDVLFDGESLLLTVNADYYDILAADCDGEVFEEYGLDIFNDFEFTINGK